jgi:hypothetical protein
MYWRYGSISRIPALQTQSPELKPSLPPPPKRKFSNLRKLYIAKVKVWRGFVCVLVMGIEARVWH